MREINLKELKLHLDKFANNLKLERLANKLTQDELAKKIGITSQSYGAYEKGATLPTSENLLKISIILEVSLDELFEIDY